MPHSLFEGDGGNASRIIQADISGRILHRKEVPTGMRYVALLCGHNQIFTKWVIPWFGVGGVSP